MTDEDIIERLENVALPDVPMDRYYRELEVLLLKDYTSNLSQYDGQDLFDRLKIRLSRFSFIRIRVLPKTRIVTAFVILIFITILTFYLAGVFSGLPSAITKAYTALERLESYRVLLDTYVQESRTDTLDYSHQEEFEYVDPDNYHITIKSIGENSVLQYDQREIIVIGDLLYSHGFHLVPDIFEVFNQMIPTKEQTLKTIDVLHNIDTLPDEYIDGFDCYHYKGTVDIDKWLDWTGPHAIRIYSYIAETLEWVYRDLDEAIKSFENTMRTREISCELWIGKDDYLIRQLKYSSQTLPDTIPIGYPYKSVTITKYYDFNESFLIEPPLTESGDLVDGWSIYDFTE